MASSPDKALHESEDHHPSRIKMSKQEADDHRRMLEEKLLGIKTDRSSILASMSNMAMAMAGASEVDPLEETEAVASRQRISRALSLPASAT